jgi:hypothetical protein
MIKEWIKRRRSAAILRQESRESEESARRMAREQESENEIAEWRERHFRDIIFPIVSLTKKDYLPVSTLEEYHYDTDINIWFVKSDCELIDSTGQKYDFKQIERAQWVPNRKTGTMEYEELKNRLTPLLYMPMHKKNITTTKTIKDIIELIINE